KDADRPHTPLVMMSGVFKNPKTAVEAREKYRVIDFLSKPLELQRLVTLIQDSLKDVEADEPPQPKLDAPSLRMNNNNNSPGDSIANVLAEGAPPPPRGLSYFGRGPSMSAPSASNGAGSGAAARASKERAAPRPPSIVGDSFRGRPFPPLFDEGDVEQIP